MIEIGAFLKTFIYLISASLLYPVLVLLAGLSVFVIVFSGGFFAEWLERSRIPACPPGKLPEILTREEKPLVVSHRVRRYLRELGEIPVHGKGGEVAVENLLQHTTLGLWKSMDRLRILVRVAPSLGLLGTLIPMGTGLAALGQGDMTRLSADLVVAFTTTVVGLGIGTMAFFFYTIRRRWIEEDIKNMELATELMVMRREAGHALSDAPPYAENR